MTNTVNKKIAARYRGLRATQQKVLTYLEAGPSCDTSRQFTARDIAGATSLRETQVKGALKRLRKRGYVGATSVRGNQPALWSLLPTQPAEPTTIANAV